MARERSRSRSPRTSSRRDYSADDDRERRTHHHHRQSTSKREYGGGEDERRRSKRDYDDDDDEERRARRREKDKRRSERETSTERRARKKAKRTQLDEATLVAAEEQRRAAAEMSMYSAVDNPFHDANLDDQFVWGKKRDKEKKAGMSAEEARRRDAERRAEAKEELERLNRRRADREVEMEEREQEASRMARMAESAQMEAWIAKEDDFLLDQSRRRAEIRTREGRAKPIDLLALNLKWSKPRVPGQEGEEEEEEDEGVGMDVDLEEPYLIFDNLTLEDTEELFEDITMYLSLEKDETSLEFWRSMMVVCSAALDMLRSERSIGRQAFMEQSRSNESVKADVTALLRGKSLTELRALQDSIRAKLSSGDPIDVEYWENLLKELAVWMAKAKLKAMHEIVLRNRLEHLRRRQRDEAVRVQEELANAVQEDEEDFAVPAVPVGAGDSAATVQEQWSEAMVPKLITRVPMEDQKLQLISAEDEHKQLIASRRIVARARFVRKKAKVIENGAAGGNADASDALIRAEAAKGLEEDEEVWQEQDIQTSGQTYSWQDKYRPRKPRYFNKVITGFEWNKYNQTHYDIDNPPPKVVQSYRFTIFCPDLVDQTKAPTYKVIREKGNDDTCVLHFKIGPPYEDLAFRIVNKEWEYSHKKGFKSTFDRGVLQLHFNFKRTFYRK